MLDTKGPEYRIGTFENERVEIKKDSIFTFTADDVIGDETRVTVSYKDITPENASSVYLDKEGKVSLEEDVVESAE